MADSKAPYQDPAVEDRSLATQTVARAGGIGGNVHREEVCIGNPSANAAIAEVLNAAPTTEYGVVVRNIPSGTQAVSGTVTANLAAGANNIGDVDVLTVPAPLSTTGGGTEATALRVTVANDSTGVLSVDDNGGSITVDQATGTNLHVVTDSGTITTVSTVTNLSQQGGVAISLNTGVRDAGTQRVTIATNDVVPVTDNGGSLTVDAAAGGLIVGDGTNPVSVVTDGADNLANTNNELVTAALAYAFDGTNWDRVTNGGGVEATAMRVTLANDSTGLVSVDDNGASLSVDWNGTQPVTGSGNATGALRVELANNGTGALSTLTTVTTVSTLTNQSQEGGVAISLNAGAVDTGTRRVVQANGAGKTILSLGGSASASGNNTLVAAGTNRLKVFAFSLTTTSATAMTCIFQSGAGGTELWRAILQAPSGANSGANLAVAPPAWLFATASATLLNLNLSSANAVHWSVSYYDEA